MSQLYTIQEETLTKIAEAIRHKYNFSDQIKITDIPYFINNDANIFWLTHFNESRDGGGSLYTNGECTIKAGECAALFETSPELPNTYQLKSIKNYTNFNHFSESDAQLQTIASYTIGGIPYTQVNGFVDDGERLKDGEKSFENPTSNANTAYSAWGPQFNHDEMTAEIIVKLQNVTQVQTCVAYGASHFWGVSRPIKMEVFVSEDGYNFTPAGTATDTTLIKYGEPAVSMGTPVHTEMYSMTLNFSRCIKGQYVKFRFYGQWIWLSELEIKGVEMTKNCFPINRLNSSLNDYEIGVYVNSVANCNLDTDDVTLSIRNGQIVSTKASEAINIAGGSGTIIQLKNFKDHNYFKNVTKIELTGVSGTFLSQSAKCILTFNGAKTVMSTDTFDNTNQFIYVLNNGTTYKNGNAETMLGKMLQWNIDDKFLFENLNLNNQVIPTNTPFTPYYDSKYNCLSTIDNLKQSTIIIDGNLEDSGWNDDDGWHLATVTSGKLTGTTLASVPYEYKYKVKCDDEYMYVGICSPFTLPNSNQTVVTRIWLNADEDNATCYTHLYGLACTNGEISIDAKRNTSLTTNVPQTIDNTSIKYIVNNTYNGFVLEFKVKLSEFLPSNKTTFSYLISSSSVFGTETATLYSTKIDTMPFSEWDFNNAIKVDLTIDEELTTDEIIRMIEEELL